MAAGALIAIADERIYMRPGGSIGAASVVDQNGKPMPEARARLLAILAKNPGREE